MQTAPLQLPTLNASTASAPPKVSFNAGGQDNQFQRALSREIEQRQAQRGAEAPARPAAKPAAGQTGAKPATPIKQPAPPKEAQATRAAGDGNDCQPGGKSELPVASATATPQKPAGKEDEAGKSDARDALDGPVGDMLALVAAFNQPAPAAAPPAALPAAGGGTGAAADAKALAADAAGAQALATAALTAASAGAKPAADLAGAADAAAAEAADFKALIAQANAAASAAEAKPDDTATAAAAQVSATLAGGGELKHATPAAAPAAAAGQPSAEDGDALADAARAAPEAKAEAKSQAGADAINKIETRAQPADNAALGARPQGDAAPLGLPAATEVRAETLTAAREGAAPAELHAVQAPAASAAQDIAKAASAVPTDKLNGRVGSPVWDQQLGQKIIFMAAGGEQSASLSLNPPDLGPLQVVLSVSNDQANAAFTSAQPEVRQALEDAMPKLREMMSEAGITLGNATVSADTSGQQQAFQQQAAASAQNGGRGGRGGSGNDGGGRLGAGADGDAAARAPARRLPAGAVDTFA